MNHRLLAVGLVRALATRPASAQTRVSVAIGFAAPRPFVTGVEVVGSRYGFYHSRPRFYRPAPLFVERVYVARGYPRPPCPSDSYGDWYVSAFPPGCRVQRERRGAAAG